MTRFSKREYFLISLLTVLLIWFVGWNQVVKPQTDHLKEARERLAQLQVEREQVDRYLNRMPEPVSGDGEPGDGFFYSGLDDVAVDRLLLQMAEDSGVVIRRMEIGDPALAEQKLPADGELLFAGIPELPLRYIQVSMELEADTFEQIAAMAEQIYCTDKSVITDQLEAEAAYGRDSSGNPEFQGIRCTMDVSFYYTEETGG